MTVPVTVRHNVAAAFVSVAIVAPLMWMLLDRDPPYTDHVGTITPADPAPGDWITVDWKLTVHRVCHGWVQREIVDSQGVICNYDKQPAIRRDQLSNQQMGSPPDRLNRSFPLCDRAAPGPARYRALTCYQCNPLQKWWPICVRTPNIQFTIRPQTTGGR